MGSKKESKRKSEAVEDHSQDTDVKKVKTTEETSETVEESDAAKHVVTFGSGTGKSDDQGRKKKSPAVRASKENLRDKSLDDEALTAKLVKLHSEEVETFFCFRCNADRISKNKYEWHTQSGMKIICNGCNGNLLSAKPKPTAEEIEALKEKNSMNKKGGNGRYRSNKNFIANQRR